MSGASAGSLIGRGQKSSEGYFITCVAADAHTSDQNTHTWPFHVLWPELPYSMVAELKSKCLKKKREPRKMDELRKS